MNQIVSYTQSDGLVEGITDFIYISASFNLHHKLYDDYQCFNHVPAV